MADNKSSKSIGNSNTLVCIDSYIHGVMTGSFFNAGTGKREEFESVVEFILKMQKVLEELKTPQSFNEMRHFMPSATIELSPSTDEEKHTGELATFSIRIIFRQNASWQGSVMWLEGKQEESFRSVLELIILMHSALTSE